jgi:hypothetical protein
MDKFETPELVRSLQRLMKKRIELRRKWALMQQARRDFAEGVFADTERLLLAELERRARLEAVWH